ncbi:spidroin-2 [Parasteatoda tepidariorum]|uniref:spidroin-2 n=1 Tax=Parasteatoda tepidariorum TaxID=114398 RepID=UPI00077F83A3|nr:spidroin-2 [Parasteatoda tepidariorum]XP_042897253.1 spidroin-2 [Parasteatoda tepidariorum]
MISVWCGLLVMVVAVHAAAPASQSSSSPTSTKREDPQNGGGGSGGQPVYSPSASSNSYSSASFDSSDNGGAYKSPQQSQGNLYYYYYPVQDKGQDNAFASSSTHNYATAPANSGPYETQDSSQTSYHTSQGGDAYQQDASYVGALNQLSQYGLANGYSLGTGGLGGAGGNAFGAYAAQMAPAGYASSGIPASAYSTGAIGSYPAGSAAVANYAAQPSTLAQYAAQLTGFGGGNQYQAATSGYGVPQGYGQPSRRYGLGSLIMPMLALAGLTMLVPTITSNLGSRTKRSTDTQAHPLTLISEYKDKLERYYSLYRTAVEKEECMNRIICEFGSAVSDVKGKGAVVLVLEKLMPKNMRPKMNVFKAGALSPEIGKCKKMFKC